MDADGSNPTQLTDSAGFDGAPAWQPVPEPQPTPRKRRRRHHHDNWSRRPHPGDASLIPEMRFRYQPGHRHVGLTRR